MIEFHLLLIGYGNVARRFASLLDERRDVLLRDHGLRARSVGIATRRHGSTLDGRAIVPASTRTFLRDAIRTHAAAAKQRRLIVISEQAHFAFGHDAIDTFARIGAVTNDITQAENF